MRPRPSHPLPRRRHRFSMILLFDSPQPPFALLFGERGLPFPYPPPTPSRWARVKSCAAQAPGSWSEVARRLRMPARPWAALSAAGCSPEAEELDEPAEAAVAVAAAEPVEGAHHRMGFGRAVVVVPAYALLRLSQRRRRKRRRWRSVGEMLEDGLLGLALFELLRQPQRYRGQELGHERRNLPPLAFEATRSRRRCRR